MVDKKTSAQSCKEAEARGRRAELISSIQLIV